MIKAAKSATVGRVRRKENHLSFNETVKCCHRKRPIAMHTYTYKWLMTISSAYIYIYIQLSSICTYTSELSGIYTILYSNVLYPLHLCIFTLSK